MNFGDTVVGIMVDNLEEALQEDFGIKTPLKGPGNALWLSPSDLLIGKVALKPPFTTKCLQALTHKGILEIGQDLEDRFKQEVELDKEKALEKFGAELLETFGDRMKLEIKEVEIKERLACHIAIQKQQQDFELLLKDELCKLEMKISKQYEQIMVDQESFLKAKWEEQLQKEVKQTVDIMKRDYLIQLDEQEEKLTELFKWEIKKQELLRDFDSKLCKRRTTEALRQLKHNLECTNLVNMMYILCTERRKCSDQKQEIEKCYKSKINCLENRIRLKDQLLAKLNAEKSEQIAEVTIRQICLVEVIKQFQKFINFALRAAPTQAEFLLSVEKMLAFELNNELPISALQKIREAPAVIPWGYGENTKPPSIQSSKLEIHDHHDCFHELAPPLNNNSAELGENDTLPTMYFKKKLYVREDFRDMLSIGAPPPTNDELWNRDVEILLANWREQLNKPMDENESVENNPIYGRDAEYVQAERRRSNKSTVQFLSSEGHTNNQEARLSGESRKLTRKSSLKPSAFPFVEDISLESSNRATSVSTILAAKDSIEILAEKWQVNDYIKEETEGSIISRNKLSSKTDGAKELVVETKDSVIMRMSEMAKTQSIGNYVTSPRDSIEITRNTLQEKECELKPKTSKLMTARNSVEVLRESLQKLKAPLLICQRKDAKKQHHKDDRGRTGFADSCCSRCKRKGDGLEFSESDLIRDTLFSKADLLADSDERSVKISHIQIINLDDHVPTASVASFHEPVISMTFANEKNTSSKKKYNTPVNSIKNRSKKSFKETKEAESSFIVGGDKNFTGDQQNEKFTPERIHSLIKLLKGQPHLMRMFTTGSH